MWIKSILSKAKGQKTDYAEILNVLSDGQNIHFALLDEDLKINVINNAWANYGSARGIKQKYQWTGRSYIDPIRQSAEKGNQDAQFALKKISELQAGKINEFSFVYPCEEIDEIKWYRCNGRHLNRQSKKHFLISHIDITEEISQKKEIACKYERLHNEKLMLEELENKMSFGFWSWQIGQDLISLSSSAAKILGQETISWDEFSDGLPHDIKIQFNHQLQKAVTGDTRLHVENEIILPNLSKKYIQLSGFLCHSLVDQTNTLFGIIRDITDEKSHEKQILQMQKLEVLGKLTAEISHDFRNSLSVIRGNTEMLREFADQNLLRFINRIHRATMQASGLTEKLTDISSSKDSIRSEFCLVKRLRDILDMSLKLIGDKIEIDFTFDDDEFCVNLNPNDFDNAILNLIINAKDAMKKGGTLSISISRSHHEFDRSKDKIILEIQDEGDGIDPDILDQILEPFFSTKPKGEGSGLGLSVVNSFMLNFGGKLDIRSKLNIGTQVILEFPVHEPDIPPLADDVPLTMPEPTQLIRGNVLIVEDEPEVRSMVIAALKRVGIDTIEAVNSVEAKHHIEMNAHIDLLFTDIILGPTDFGTDLAQWFLDKHPTKQVLFTSGYTEKALEKRGLGGLDIDMIEKPYSLDELIEAIKNNLLKSTPPLSHISPAFDEHPIQNFSQAPK